jgi:molybdopterin-guanine dinucleotide biosynthesis protein A
MQIAHNEKTRTAALDVTGVLLAWGKSRRMGHDKAHLEFEGRPLFSKSLDLLREYFTTVLIAGDRPDLTIPEVLSIPDIYPGSALGGLFTGLQSAKTEWIFVAPCDMPYPDARIIDLIPTHRTGTDAVVPRTPGGYEPVFALYNKSCLPYMEKMLKEGQFRIYDFYQQINIRYLDWHELPDGWERALLNINTPEQLDRLKEDST